MHWTNELSEIIHPRFIKFNEPMKNYTSFKTGGPAQCMVIPDTKDSLIKIVEFIRVNKIPFFILGRGSNILVSDKGIEGIVIKINESSDAIRIEKRDCHATHIVAESGASLQKLATFALDNSLKGLEFAKGIPGLLGGAIKMNAGAYDGEFKKIVMSVEYIDLEATLKVVSGAELEFAYRKSFFSNKETVITEAKLSLEQGQSDQIEKVMFLYANKRKEKQPLNYPSAGSVFKRPEGCFAAKLIEDAGLKGARMGDAMVSEKHAGFIVNVGFATSTDIDRLIKHVKDRVYLHSNINLECEILFVGQW